MTRSLSCLMGEHDACEQLVIVDNETFPCDCNCHAEESAA